MSYLVYEYHEIAYDVCVSYDCIPYGKTKPKHCWLICGKGFVVVFFHRCGRVTERTNDMVLYNYK